MLEVNSRDVKKRGKVLRNKGIITGTLKRKDGKICNIQLFGSNLDTIVYRTGLKIRLQIKFEGELINTKINRVQRDVLFHNIINIDFLEA